MWLNELQVVDMVNVCVRNFVESHKIMMICWQNELFRM